MKTWLSTGKNTNQKLKNDGHPVYTRYPHLSRKMKAEETKTFAWLPTRTVHGRWVWLTDIVKVQYTTISGVDKSVLPKYPYFSKHSKTTTFYETPIDIAQRKLSNED